MVFVCARTMRQCAISMTKWLGLKLMGMINEQRASRTSCVTMGVGRGKVILLLDKEVQ